MRYISGLLLLLLLSLNLYSSDNYPLDSRIDVLNYSFDIYLSDSYDMIKAEAVIRIAHLDETEMINLDLIERGKDGKGMNVESVFVNGEKAMFTHRDGRLSIKLEKKVKGGNISNITIKYYGIPANGLIISENRYGERTFFADNWPDRARHWIPCVDHPSDKAKVEYRVFAPEHYKVVANGTLVEESNLEDGIKLTHWKEDISIPTKVMVIGVARFASQLVENVGGTDIWTYVFPGDRENGFSDYRAAVEPFIFFSNEIGSYSYEKLANVQSKTMFGGMENAGCIFYSERSVSGKNRVEGLMAHEIAHQWFGNSVTERDWHHIWLSEGFATYYTSRFLEHKYGESRMRTQMTNSRNRIIKAIEREPAPLVDTTITDFMNLLSTYSYQKGAWVLHMLRNELGESVFRNSVRTYYSRFRNRTALSSDLLNTLEEVSGKELKVFFYQWLYRDEIPLIDSDWTYNTKTHEATLNLRQIQEGGLFVFPLEVEIITKDGKKILKELFVDKKLSELIIKTEEKPLKINLDPGVKVLFREI